MNSGAGLPISGDGTYDGLRCRPMYRKTPSNANSPNGTMNFHMVRGPPQAVRAAAREPAGSFAAARRVR